MVMKLEKVLKFKGIGNRKLEEVFHLSPIPDSRFPMPLTVLSTHSFTVRVRISGLTVCSKPFIQNIVSGYSPGVAK